jgi:hypothetical protein
MGNCCPNTLEQHDTVNLPAPVVYQEKMAEKIHSEPTTPRENNQNLRSDVMIENDGFVHIN